MRALAPVPRVKFNFKPQLCKPTLSTFQSTRQYSTSPQLQFQLQLTALSPKPSVFTSHKRFLSIRRPQQQQAPPPPPQQQSQPPPSQYQAYAEQPAYYEQKTVEYQQTAYQNGHPQTTGYVQQHGYQSGHYLPNGQFVPAQGFNAVQHYETPYQPTKWYQPGYGSIPPNAFFQRHPLLWTMFQAFAVSIGFIFAFSLFR
jgi:hypothetical protein